MTIKKNIRPTATIVPDSKAGSRSIWWRFVTVTLIICNVICGLGLIVSGYAGAINPVNHPTASVIGMTFAIWLAATFGLLILTLLIRKRVAIILGVAIVASLPAITDFSPFHLPAHASEDADTFTLMSYNVFGLKDQKNVYPDDINPTISYIISQDPDIVCLQEMVALSPNSNIKLSAAQIDSLHRLYPYVYYANLSHAIFSKFPVEPIQTGFVREQVSGAANMGCFRVTIHGRKITIFDIHLQSFSLGPDDRAMFSRLAHLKGDEEEITEMRTHLMNKIRAAAPIRVADTEELIRYIKHFGGPNVIVCGDFNDVPGSYPLRMLRKEHLREVYPEVGFGPMITYNTGGFYFRIDHILYRGDLRPIAMKRGNIKSSDHYPIIATFEITAKK